MTRTLSTKEISALISGFEKQGCRIQDTGNGYKIYPPNGGQILTLHLTLSDHRGMQNFKSVARRVGLRWPLDKKA